MISKQIRNGGAAGNPQLLGEGGQFSLGLWSLVSGSCSSGWTHIQEYAFITNWSQGILKKKKRREM